MVLMGTSRWRGGRPGRIRLTSSCPGADALDRLRLEPAVVGLAVAVSSQPVDGHDVPRRFVRGQPGLYMSDGFRFSHAGVCDRLDHGDDGFTEAFVRDA